MDPLDSSAARRQALERLDLLQRKARAGQATQEEMTELQVAVEQQLGPLVNALGGMTEQLASRRGGDVTFEFYVEEGQVLPTRIRVGVQLPVLAIDQAPAHLELARRIGQVVLNGWTAQRQMAQQLAAGSAQGRSGEGRPGGHGEAAEGGKDGRPAAPALPQAPACPDCSAQLEFLEATSTDAEGFRQERWTCKEHGPAVRRVALARTIVQCDQCGRPADVRVTDGSLKCWEDSEGLPGGRSLPDPGTEQPGWTA